jgi:hypothetical protein
MKEIIAHTTLTGRLCNTEHFEFYHTIYDYIEEYPEIPVALQPLWETIRDKYLQEGITIREALVKKKTEFVRLADKKRKQAYVGLKLLVKSASYNSRKEVQEAAEELLWTLANYSDIYRTSLTSASALITKLVQEMRKPARAPYIALVGAGELVEQLSRANEAFLDCYSDRIYNEHEEKERGGPAYIRKQVDQAFGKLTAAINALYQTQLLDTLLRDTETDNETLSNLISCINGVIHHYDTIYARRPWVQARHKKRKRPAETESRDD